MSETLSQDPEALSSGYTLAPPYPATSSSDPPGSNLPPFSTFSAEMDASAGFGSFTDSRLLDISNWDYYTETRLLDRGENGLSIIASQPQYRPWESKPVDSHSQTVTTFADAFAQNGVSKLPSFQSQFQTFSDVVTTSEPTLTTLTPVSPNVSSPNLTTLGTNFHALNARNYPLVPAPIQAREIPSIQQQFLDERHIQLYTHPTTFPPQNGTIIQNISSPTVVTVLKSEPELKLDPSIKIQNVTLHPTQFQNPMSTIIDNTGLYNGLDKKLNGISASMGSPTRSDFRKKERRKMRASSLESSAESDGASSNMEIGNSENSGQVAAVSSTASFKHHSLGNSLDVDDLGGGSVDKQVKKKRKRCGECIGCQRKDNCGDCAPCRNDKSHQICKQRRCEKLTEKKNLYGDPSYIRGESRRGRGKGRGAGSYRGRKPSGPVITNSAVVETTAPSSRPSPQPVHMLKPEQPVQQQPMAPMPFYADPNRFTTPVWQTDPAQAWPQGQFIQQIAPAQPQPTLDGYTQQYPNGLYQTTYQQPAFESNTFYTGAVQVLTRPPSVPSQQLTPRANGSYTPSPSPVQQTQPQQAQQPTANQSTNQQPQQRTVPTPQYHQAEYQSYPPPATPTSALEDGQQQQVISRPNSVNSNAPTPTTNQSYQGGAFTSVSSTNFSPSSNSNPNFVNAGSGNETPGYPQVNSNPPLVSHSSSGYPGQYGGSNQQQEQESSWVNIKNGNNQHQQQQQEQPGQEPSWANLKNGNNQEQESSWGVNLKNGSDQLQQQLQQQPQEASSWGNHESGNQPQQQQEPPSWTNHDNMMWEQDQAQQQQQQHLNESAKESSQSSQPQTTSHFENEGGHDPGDQYNQAHRVNINSRIKTMILNKQEKKMEVEKDEHNKTGHFLWYSHHRRLSSFSGGGGLPHTHPILTNNRQNKFTKDGFYHLSNRIPHHDAFSYQANSIQGRSFENNNIVYENKISQKTDDIKQANQRFLYKENKKNTEEQKRTSQKHFQYANLEHHPNGLYNQNVQREYYKNSEQDRLYEQTVNKTFLDHLEKVSSHQHYLFKNNQNETILRNNKIIKEHQNHERGNVIYETNSQDHKFEDGTKIVSENEGYAEYKIKREPLSHEHIPSDKKETTLEQNYNANISYRKDLKQHCQNGIPYFETPYEPNNSYRTIKSSPQNESNFPNKFEEHCNGNYNMHKTKEIEIKIERDTIEENWNQKALYSKVVEGNNQNHSKFEGNNQNQNNIEGNNQNQSKFEGNNYNQNKIVGNYHNNFDRTKSKSEENYRDENNAKEMHNQNIHRYQTMEDFENANSGKNEHQHNQNFYNRNNMDENVQNQNRNDLFSKIGMYNKFDENRYPQPNLLFNKIEGKFHHLRYNSLDPNCQNGFKTIAKKNEKKNAPNFEDDKVKSNVGVEIPSCTCFPPDKFPPEPGTYYTHLGCSSDLVNLRKDLESRTGVNGKAIRIEKVCYTGKEGKTSQGCPIAKWIIRRSNYDEKYLIIVKHRRGHSCYSAFIVVCIVAWDGVQDNDADTLYLTLSEKLNKFGLPTARRCATNEQRSCACQGLNPDKCGASFSFGCSWSMYYNGCKFARSKTVRKFRLSMQTEELILEDKLQKLASHLTPLYKALAPVSFYNQCKFENVAKDCRLGITSGMPFSGVTACLDFCAHAHKDTQNMNSGCTVVVTLTKERVLGKASDEQLHVLPLYSVDNTDEFGDSQEEKIKDGSIEILNRYECEVRVRTVPLQPCRRRKRKENEAKEESSPVKSPELQINQISSTVQSSPLGGHNQKHLSTSYNQRTDQKDDHHQPTNYMQPQYGEYPHHHQHHREQPNNIRTAFNATYPFVQPYSYDIRYTREDDIFRNHKVQDSNSGLNSTSDTIDRFYSVRNASGGLFSLTSNSNHIYPVMGTAANDVYSVKGIQNDIYPFQHSVNDIYPIRFNPPDLYSANTVYQMKSMNHSGDLYPVKNNVYPAQNDVYPMKSNYYPLNSNVYPVISTDGNDIYPTKSTANSDVYKAITNENDIRPMSSTPRSDICSPISTINEVYPVTSATDDKYSVKHSTYPVKSVNYGYSYVNPSANPHSINDTNPNVHQINSTQNQDVYKVSNPFEDNPYWYPNPWLNNLKAIPEDDRSETLGKVTEISENLDAFKDSNMGGVAIALSHGSVLFECAKYELHATTALKSPNRLNPTRISLVFYQHRNLNKAKHGWDEYEEKMRLRKLGQGKDVPNLAVSLTTLFPIIAGPYQNPQRYG